MKRLTNNSNLPLSVAVWLASDSYDFKFNDKRLSATDMGKSIRQLVLRNRLRQAGDTIIMQEDITQRLKSRFGHAIHDAIENVWNNEDRRNMALAQLGYPEQVRKRIVINPSSEYVEQNPNCIPVYMEQRNSREIAGYTISGQFDFLAEAQLEDFKSTGTYTYEKGVNDKKFALQGSIYRWLNITLIKKPTVKINYLFTDWNANKALASNKYPPSPVMSVPIKLWSVEETEQYLRTKLMQLDANKEVPETELPFCSAEELWQGDTEYKYFAKAESIRASKNFGTDVRAAYAHLQSKGNKGLIREIPSEARACAYCECHDICSQRKQLEASGIFKPKR